MKDEEAAGAEEPDERRGDERIDEGLSEIQPCLRRLVGWKPSGTRERVGRLEAVRLAPLQKHALGSRGVFLPHAHQIATLVGEIEIPGEALTHQVVRRLVTLEAVLGAREVDRRGDAEQHERDGGGGGDSRIDPAGRRSGRAVGRNDGHVSNSSWTALGHDIASATRFASVPIRCAAASSSMRRRSAAASAEGSGAHTRP